MLRIDIRNQNLKITQNKGSTTDIFSNNLIFFLQWEATMIMILSPNALRWSMWTVISNRGRI